MHLAKAHALGIWDRVYFGQKLQRTAATIHTAEVVVNVSRGVKHRVQEIFCGQILLLCMVYGLARLLVYGCVWPRPWLLALVLYCYTCFTCYTVIRPITLILLNKYFGTVFLICCLLIALSLVNHH